MGKGGSGFLAAEWKRVRGYRGARTAGVDAQTATIAPFGGVPSVW